MNEDEKAELMKALSCLDADPDEAKRILQGLLGFSADDEEGALPVWYRVQATRWVREAGVDAACDRTGLDPAVLWSAIEGKPHRRLVLRKVEELATTPLPTRSCTTCGALFQVSRGGITSRCEACCLKTARKRSKPVSPPPPEPAPPPPPVPVRVPPKPVVFKPPPPPKPPPRPVVPREELKLPPVAHATSGAFAPCPACGGVRKNDGGVLYCVKNRCPEALERFGRVKE